MKRLLHLLRRHGPRLALVLPLLLAATEASARAGGGHSYSGGSHSSSSHGGDSGGGGGDGSGLVLLVFELLFRYPKIGVPLILIAVVGFVVMQRSGRLGPGISTGADDALGVPASAQAWGRGSAALTGLESLRQADPAFSEPLFLDFVAALVARSVAVTGTPRLAEVDRYLLGPRVLLPFGAGGWQNVVVGSTRLAGVQVTPEVTRVDVEVALAASNAAGGRWWRTTWTFVRKPGVVSKGPGEITRLACPACGAGSERREDGACRYCGARPSPGEAAWAAERVLVDAEEPRPPISLGGYAEEAGTEYPTVQSPTLDADLAALPQRLPGGFEWSAAEARFGQVFLQLQQAWSSRDLAALRPLTTDAVFSTWRFWIEAYRAAGLRNQLEQIQVARVDPARVSLDAFYAAVTVRIFASMVDRTVDEGGRVVDGQAAPRRFSEYWTFVRTLSAARPEGVTCSGCGATLAAGQTGQCPYCGSLVGAPAFDWILSRIDQDEDYSGT
jgi:hypothetical protein